MAPIITDLPVPVDGHTRSCGERPPTVDDRAVLGVERLGGAARVVRLTWPGGVIGRRIVTGDTAVPMRDAVQYPVSADLATAIEGVAHELAERVRVSERHDRMICTCGYAQRVAADIAGQ